MALVGIDDDNTGNKQHKASFFQIVKQLYKGI